MISEAIKGNLMHCSRDLRDAADNASAAYNTLAPDNPLAGQAVFELMRRINAASHYADLLSALAKEDGE